jgi:hypothetical protein
MAQAGLIVPISGPYIGIWNGLPLGTQNDDGYELSCTIQGQEINASDAYGLTLVEGIYRGQNWRLRFRGLEWNQEGLIAILEMFGDSGADTLAPLLGVPPGANPIGDRWTKFGGTLLLTAILGNPPSVPQTLTALSSAFAPNSQTAFNMTSKMREFPLEMVLFPYATTVLGVDVIVPFTCT